MRHAMRDMLRRPPLGFEEVVRRHFLTVRPLLERQCAAWLSECKSPSNKAAMEKAYSEILELIDAAQALEQGGGSSSDPQAAASGAAAET